MITQNFMACMALQVGAHIKRNLIWGLNGSADTPNFDPVGISDFSLNVINILTTQQGSGIKFGTGNRAPTFYDYNLSGSLITTLTGTASQVFDMNNNKITTTFTLTNTGGSSVTINEVGCFSPIKLHKEGGTIVNWPMMCDRTVLDSPVVITAGGVGQVVYSIQFNIPSE